VSDANTDFREAFGRAIETIDRLRSVIKRVSDAGDKLVITTIATKGNGLLSFIDCPRENLMAFSDAVNAAKDDAWRAMPAPSAATRPAATIRIEGQIARFNTHQPHQQLSGPAAYPVATVAGPLRAVAVVAYAGGEIEIPIPSEMVQGVSRAVSSGGSLAATVTVEIGDV
jgi:hypothetical protein